MRLLNLTTLIVILFVFGECTSPEGIRPIDAASKGYITENVVIVMIDGPRFTETWGDNAKSLIPNYAQVLAPQGVVISRFYNNGNTFTLPGHTAITTGHYQMILNDGKQFPNEPSLFQAWLSENDVRPDKAYIVATKAKLNVLTDCVNGGWKSRFNPSFVATRAGKDMTDKEAYETAISVMDQKHPQLMMVHFKGPDFHGHGNRWQEYLGSIAETDQYLVQLWEHIQNDPLYAGKTSLFVTNDHGRHLDAIKDGFISHGDGCDGCRHINFLAIGPDFKSNAVLETPAEQIDIAPTIAEIMGFSFPNSPGRVLTELFK